MYVYKNAIYIARSQQEVWDFVSNPANNAKWTKAEPAEWTSKGPPGVGTTVREAAKVLGRLVESPTEITVWDPPNEYGRKSIGGKIAWESLIKLEPKNGGTQLSIVAQGQIHGFFKILSGLAGRQARKNTDADLKALKRLLDSRQD